MNHLTDLDAIALSRAIHARRVSCREVMQAYLARTHRLNPRRNAIVSLVDDAVALREADARDAELGTARGRGRGRRGSRGWTHGMPQAIKDTGHAVGFPTTLGSPLPRDARPAQDSVYVARMKAAGCIVIGKTNMPEFGLGSNTYNALFGRTPNAWDATRSAGGSSGGAVVALAQVWPFDVQVDWPKSIAGRTMDTYHRWMEVTLYATFAGLPAISVPAGFDAAGRLPMGPQLVGRPLGDAPLLAAAAGYEALIGKLLARRPSALA